MRRSRITTMFNVLLALAILDGCFPDSTGPATPAGASLLVSTISARATTLTANGVDTTTVTVAPRDANGAAVTLASGAVRITATRGSLGRVEQNADGTFAAVLTASDTAGLEIVVASVNGELLHDSLFLLLVPGPPSAAHSLLGVTSPSIIADGTSSTTIFVQPRDANGNTITDVAVTMTTTKGTLSPVVAESSGPWDYGDDGHYSATLTSTTSVDSAIVSVKIAEEPFGAPIVVQFVPHP
jgi:adhesin/invasin